MPANKNKHTEAGEKVSKAPDSQAQNESQSSLPQNELPPLEKEKVLFEWEALSRPYKKLSKEFYINLGAIFLFFIVLFFVVEGIMPALVVASVYFLFYVFTSVKPANIKYKITNYGVVVDDQKFDWYILGRYKIVTRFGHKVLIIETAEPPWKTEMVMKQEDIDKIEEILSGYLYKDNSPPGVTDKAVNWVSKKLKIE